MTVVAQDYPLLFACYRSGQVSESQWQEHLRDKRLCEWLEERRKGDPIRHDPADYARLLSEWELNRLDPDDIISDAGMRAWLERERPGKLGYVAADLSRWTIIQAEQGDKARQQYVERRYGFDRVKEKYRRITGRDTLSWREAKSVSQEAANVIREQAPPPGLALRILSFLLLRS